MRGKFTVFMMVVFALATLAAAKNINAKKIPVSKQVKLSNKVRLANPVEPLFPYADGSRTAQRQASNQVRSTTPARHVHVSTSGNGYGWLSPLQRSTDRFSGTDADGTDRDMLLLGYRGTGDGNADMCAGEIDVSAGLANGTVWTFENDDALNSGIDPYGSGARYPCVEALERPVVCFNQYTGDVSNPTDPAYSHPYLVTEYGTYGDDGGSWTTPDFLMDDGWVDPTVASIPNAGENRLWLGPTAIARDGDGVYHWLAVYETWFTDAEKKIYGYGNTKHIFTAKSDGNDLSNGWITSWNDTPASNPVWIDTNLVWLPREGVAMNGAGFGVVLGPGHLGHSDPDLDYYYTGTKITYSITEDYGLTWSDWDTVSFTSLGIPSYIYASDKYFIVSVNGTDTTWYQGPAFVGTNFDMSVMVDDDNTIWVGFNSLWGEPTEDGWYPGYQYSGVLLAKKTYGQAWGGARIAYNNGIWQGDDQIAGMSNFFFDSEVQISLDETGNVYASWLDRRHNDVQVSRFARYSDPDDNNGTVYNTFKTDIYASHSINGGQDWSDPINCTDSPSLDEYELNMSLHSANTNDRGDFGKIWFAYVLPDTEGHDPAHDAYIEMTNEVWAGEADNFNPLAIGNQKQGVVKTFGLQQNYPNPFNPTTRISFVPERSGLATLTVYNVSGQKISTLFSGRVNKGVPYKFNFDGKNLAAGLYFYRLQTGNTAQVKKMMLIK